MLEVFDGAGRRRFGGDDRLGRFLGTIPMPVGTASATATFAGISEGSSFVFVRSDSGFLDAGDIPTVSVSGTTVTVTRTSARYAITILIGVW